MTISTDVVIGLDIGTTSAKAVVRPTSRRDARYVTQPTRGIPATTAGPRSNRAASSTWPST